MKNYKLKYFLIATLMYFQSVYASDSFSERISNSKFSFPKTIDSDWDQSEIAIKNNKTTLTYDCLNQDNLITRIVLVIDDTKNPYTSIKFYVNSTFFKKYHLELEKNLNVKITQLGGINRSGYFMVSTIDDKDVNSLKNFKDRLKYLYRINVIPDLIMNEIKKSSGYNNQRSKEVVSEINSK